MAKVTMAPLAFVGTCTHMQHPHRYTATHKMCLRANRAGMSKLYDNTATGNIAC